MFRKLERQPVRALFCEFPKNLVSWAVPGQLVTPVLAPNHRCVFLLFVFVFSTFISDRICLGEALSFGDIDTLTTKLKTLQVNNTHSSSRPILWIPTCGCSPLLHANPAYIIKETRQGPYAFFDGVHRYGDLGGSNPTGFRNSFPSPTQRCHLRRGRLQS